MATDTADRWSGHVRGLTVTTLAAVAGVAAALVSTIVTAGPADLMGIYVLAGAILVQFPLLQVVGIDTREFSAKDYLYIAFMTFSFWFVAWTILLTTGTAL